MVTGTLTRKEYEKTKPQKVSFAQRLGRAYGIASSKLKTAGGKTKELAQKHSPAIKSAVRTGFIAGLAAAKKIKIQEVKTRKKRTARKTKPTRKTIKKTYRKKSSR